MYKRIILPFQMDMNLFNTSLVNRSKANYDELSRQIFQVMVKDLVLFNTKLETLPNIQLLTVNGGIYSSPDFKEIFKSYALNIYFTCFEYKLFDNGIFNHLLEHINEDHFLLYCCEPPNF